MPPGVLLSPPKPDILYDSGVDGGEKETSEMVICWESYRESANK